MTEYSALIKKHAKSIRQVVPGLSITHGQALELAVSMLTEAESWNHFSASPVPLRVPGALEEFFSAIGRGQRRLLQLDGNKAAIEGRGRRSLLVLKMLAMILVDEPDGLKAISQLMAGTEMEPLGIVENGEAKKATLTEYPELAAYHLGTWFFRRDKFSSGNYPWDLTEKLALKLGFTSEQASLIRSLQREAPNHSWPIELWFDVGVLDGDQESFLEELKTDDGWEDYFEELYNTDGFSVAD